VRLGEIAVDEAFDAIVAADVRSEDGKVIWRKGTVLGPADVGAIEALSGVEVHLVDLDPGEVGQDEVARRLARAIGGPGTTADAPQQGQARLRATSRGLLAVDGDAVRALNRLGPVLCFTQRDGQVVLAGDEIAGVKGAGLATAGSTVAAAEAIAAGAGWVVRVLPFPPRRVHVLITERLGARSRGLVAEAVRSKLAFYGSRAVDIAEVAYARAPVAAWLSTAVASGAELLLLSGANSLDPLDPVLLAIGDAGGELARTGVPAHPGSMVWAGTIGPIPLLGIATCSGFGKSTSLDLLLARVLADEDPGAAVAALGHGGLLDGPGAEFSFPPYARAIAPPEP
jgi:molybdenum cofactor cytidylyltransferase